MNFILTDNNFVVIGPKPWNKRAFEATLQDDLDITFTLPSTNDAYLEVSPTVKFYPVTYVEPYPFNSKIQQYAGPFYTFSADAAVGTYNAADKNIDEVKGNLKGIIAAKRYDKECSGLKVTVQGNEVFVYTDRANRNMYMQQYLFMADNTTALWKFPEMWLTLTKAEMGAIIASGAAHIHAAFAWENSKVVEIDACTTLAELDAVVLEQV